MSDWQFFSGSSEPHSLMPITERPAWRQFMSEVEFTENWKTPDEEAKSDKSWKVLNDDRWKALRDAKRQDDRSRERGRSFRIRQEELGRSEILNAVNSALALRRPLLVTGNPGSGKTSLAYAIAYELQLGPVLLWPITTRAILQDALYRYDAIARLQDTQFDKSELELQILLANTEGGSYDREKIDQIKRGRNLGDYIQLGPVGTAFLPSDLPRVLLIDEIDKSDLNLPNDLLNLFEEGTYEIPELVRQKTGNPVTVRTADDQLPAEIVNGKVTCYEFPLIIMTSNGERDFPPAFLRRCLRITMPDPKDDTVLQNIVSAHFEREAKETTWAEVKQQIDPLITNFAKALQRDKADLATDQLLNLVYMVRKSQLNPSQDTEQEKSADLAALIEALKRILLKRLSSEADGK
ncbi:MAG: AAA family ATPase [Leptolyngbyaceae cyanobacterium bins.59]|nr:AAA family ATPase [Leptolyngbyaceae cyanobacterium bins.59]